MASAEKTVVAEIVDAIVAVVVFAGSFVFEIVLAIDLALVKFAGFAGSADFAVPVGTSATLELGRFVFFAANHADRLVLRYTLHKEEYRLRNNYKLPGRYFP